MKGSLIVLGGPDGSGKTTLALLLSRYLSMKGLSVRIVRIRGTHTLSYVLMVFLRRFKAFNGKGLHYYSFNVPPKLKGFWLIVELASVLPLILLYYYIYRLVYDAIISERGPLDFAVWVLTGVKPKLTKTVTKLFLKVSIAWILHYETIYIRADKEKLFERGLKKENLFIARFTDFEEVFSRFLIKNEDFKGVPHNSSTSELSFIGETSLGVKLFFNKVVAEADAKILLGEAFSSLLFNFFNPFLQMVFGLTSEETIAEILKLISLNLNPSHELKSLIKELMNFISIDLALTLIPSVKNGVVNVILGELNEVLVKEEAFVNEALKVEVESKAGLAIGSAGGSFFDSSFLNSLPGLKSLSDAVEDGGAIVYLAECRNGLGFKPLIKKQSGKNDAYAIFKRLIQCFISKVSDKAKVYLISSLPNYYAREILGVKPCETVNAALKNAKLNLKSREYTLILPYASYTILELKENAR